MVLACVTNGSIRALDLVSSNSLQFRRGSEIRDPNRLRWRQVHESRRSVEYPQVMMALNILYDRTSAEALEAAV